MWRVVRLDAKRQLGARPLGRAVDAGQMDQYGWVERIDLEPHPDGAVVETEPEFTVAGTELDVGGPPGREAFRRRDGLVDPSRESPRS